MECRDDLHFITVSVDVIKVDRTTLNQYKINNIVVVTLGFSDALKNEVGSLVQCMSLANVGDYVRFKESGNIYKRIRGGWRKPTDEDMAELVVAQLK
jgi:hypothetical protein